MRISFTDARALAVDILTQYGVTVDHAGIVADHLIDAAAAGHAFAGLPRILALVAELQKRPPATPIQIVQGGPNSTLFDGGGHNGYVTSILAVDEAIAIAREKGIAIVGVRNTWFSGRLAYYVERAARAGFIAMHTANTMARVAPAGGVDRIFGTNPVAFAFPSDPDPVVIDFGTGMTTWGEVLLREKLGTKLEPGCAVDAGGKPTIEPSEALDGAFLPWGGHRGYGLSLVVQLFALLCGSDVVVRDVADCGFFFLVIDPELLGSASDFRAKSSALVKHIEESRPAQDVAKVRVPGRASTAKRIESQASGFIEVDDAIFASLVTLRDAEPA